MRRVRHLFRAANVWWCAQYVIVMLVFMSVVVTVWGSVGMFVV